jgi:hypothetical protein
MEDFLSPLGRCWLTERRISWLLCWRGLIGYTPHRGLRSLQLDQEPRYLEFVTLGEGKHDGKSANVVGKKD